MEFRCNIVRTFKILSNKFKIKNKRERGRGNFLIMSDVYAYMNVQNFFLEVSDMAKLYQRRICASKKRAMR